MNNDPEKIKAIEYSLKITEKRLEELNGKKVLTRSEEFEKDQAIYTIHLGRKLLGIKK